LSSLILRAHSYLEFPAVWDGEPPSTVVLASSLPHSSHPYRGFAGRSGQWTAECSCARTASFSVITYICIPPLPWNQADRIMLQFSPLTTPWILPAASHNPAHRPPFANSHVSSAFSCASRLHQQPLMSGVENRLLWSFGCLFIFLVLELLRNVPLQETLSAPDFSYKVCMHALSPVKQTNRISLLLFSPSTPPGFALPPLATTICLCQLPCLVYLLLHPYISHASTLQPLQAILCIWCRI
jgi:hypothetical protein